MINPAHRNQIIPYRAIFMFQQRCNMRCTFCYVPFDGRGSSLSNWIRVLDRIAEFGVKAITFGGGDPFAQKHFAKLLFYQKQAHPHLITHIDTNGIGLGSKDITNLSSQLVFTLGLPLDGSTALTHAISRGNINHFDHVLGLIKESNSAKVPIRINTLVGKHNIELLHSMADLLSSFSISNWSLYQFWPISGASVAAAATHQVSNQEFIEATQMVCAAFPRLQIEPRSVQDRVKPYFFVRDTGDVYTIGQADVNSYLDLGSIFADNVLEEWRRVAPHGQGRGRSLSSLKA